MRSLRDRLGAGDLPPGRRIAAADLAQTLRLSATPVREALSRLAGEGLLDEMRGQGFYVPLYTAGDVADLYRLAWVQLWIGLAPDRPVVSPQPLDAPALGEDPIDAVDRLFAGWILQSGSRVLVASYRRTQAQLSPLRRLEPQLFDDLSDEAAGLVQAARASSRRAQLGTVRRFYDRRIVRAERLAALAAARRDDAKI